MQATVNNILSNTKIISGSFSEHLTGAYELFIFISESEISCAVADKKNHYFIALESWILTDEITPAQLLRTAIKESEILHNSNFRSVICCSGFRSSTIVPDPLFTYETAKDQLLLSSPVKNTDEILIDEVQSIQAKIVFAVPMEIYSLITSHFRNVEFHHTATAVTGYLISERRNSTEHLLNINIQNTFFEIIVTKGSHLILYNSFKFDSAEEMIYYLLFICEQLHLNPESVELQFSGNLNAVNPIFVFAEKYFRNIRFASRPGNYSYDMSMDQLPSHAHFNLFSQVVCA